METQKITKMHILLLLQIFSITNTAAKTQKPNWIFFFYRIHQNRVWKTKPRFCSAEKIWPGEENGRPFFREIGKKPRWEFKVEKQKKVIISYFFWVSFFTLYFTPRAPWQPLAFSPFFFYPFFSVDFHSWIGEDKVKAVNWLFCRIWGRLARLRVTNHHPNVGSQQCQR